MELFLFKLLANGDVGWRPNCLWRVPSYFVEDVQKAFPSWQHDERINTAVFMNVLPTLPSFCDSLNRGYRELENSSPKEVKAWRERAWGVR